MKLTNELFLNKLKKKRGDEYTAIVPYISTKERIAFLHNRCKRIISMSPNDILSGKNCKFCSMEDKKNKLRKTNETFQLEINNLYPNEYILISNYENCFKKVLIKHSCGYCFEIIPGNFLKGENRCRKCFKYNSNNLKTPDQFNKEIFVLVGKEYTILSEYKNVKEKIKIRHEKCKHEYTVLPTNFIKGRRCPYCFSSKNEKIIEKFLIEKNILFKKEKTFTDLRDKWFLRFDFYLIDYNILIEYDGEYHFLPIKGENYLTATKNRDLLKNNYCIKNKIPLVRIPYWKQNDIDTILEKLAIFIKNKFNYESFNNFIKNL